MDFTPKNMVEISPAVPKGSIVVLVVVANDGVRVATAESESKWKDVTSQLDREKVY